MTDFTILGQSAKCAAIVLRFDFQVVWKRGDKQKLANVREKSIHTVCPKGPFKKY